MDEELTTTEAAAFLGVCTKTLYRWDAKGKLTPANKIDRGSRRKDRRYKRVDLEKLLGGSLPKNEFNFGNLPPR